MALLTPRRVHAIQGLEWIRTGASLVLLSPIGWISTVTVWLMVLIVAIYFPTLGPVLFSLSLPGIFAGFMLGCLAIETHHSLKVRHLLRAFRRNPRKLLQLGMVNILGEILLSLVLVVWGGQSVLDLQNLNPETTNQLSQVQNILSTLSPLLISLMLIQLAMLMMSWFTPALLIFTSLTTIQALTESSRACFSNLPAFGVFTLVMAAILAVGSLLSILLPFLALPIGILVMSLIIASVYASYRDIFSDIPLQP